MRLAVWKKSLTTNHRHHREEIIPDAQPINPAHFEQLLHQLQKKKRIVLITGAGNNQPTQFDRGITFSLYFFLILLYCVFVYFNFFEFIVGCSTESGIPDYRSPNGSYSKGIKFFIFIF